MMNSESAPVYTRRFWAKARPYRQRGPESIHLLEHHLADVGACFEALLEQPTIRRRLARSGGLDGLDGATAARLALFAALHDIGKVNVGFQTQVWLDSDMPMGRIPANFRRVGHTLDLTPVLTGDDSAAAQWFFDALGWWHQATAAWDDNGGETVCALFIAALSHHGEPLQLEGKRGANSSIWQPCGGLNPAEGVERIGYLARRWFPAAFAPDAPPLPSAPAFQHHFLGLCTLADWIGSNERWFPYSAEPDDAYINDARRKARAAVEEIGLDLSNQRRALPDALPSFEAFFDFSPNAIQRTAQDRPSLCRGIMVEIWFSPYKRGYTVLRPNYRRIKAVCPVQAGIHLPVVWGFNPHIRFPRTRGDKHQKRLPSPTTG